MEWSYSKTSFNPKGELKELVKGNSKGHDLRGSPPGEAQAPNRLSNRATRRHDDAAADGHGQTAALRSARALTESDCPKPQMSSGL